MIEVAYAALAIVVAIVINFLAMERLLFMDKQVLFPHALFIAASLLLTLLVLIINIKKCEAKIGILYLPHKF